MVFPVVGNVSYVDDFGDPRPAGPHEGNDIMARRHAPAVAAAAGRVRFWTSSASAGCMLYLFGANGTTYIYIHLNNDLTNSNDNRGRCVPGVAYAPGLASGDRVKQGEVIGFVGDSGNANGVHPHLHFEVHPNDGAAVDPYRYLRAAPHLLWSTPGGTSQVTVTLRGKVRSTFSDDSGNRFLCVSVRRVRLSTGWRGLVRKRVLLAVPSGAAVRRRTSSGLVTARLRSAEPGERVRVRTPPLDNVLENQLARRGDLDAASVLLG